MLGTLSRNVLPARLLAALCALLVAAIASTSMAAAPPAPAIPVGMTSVIVRGEAGMLVRLEHSTVLAGGVIVRELRLIDAFSAQVPANRLAAISILPGVIAVSPDYAVSLHSDYNPGTDPNSMASTAAAIGASTAWAAGITGTGVDVALVDSGVTPVPGLAGDRKVVNGPDLSIDSQNPALRYLDGFGHGTFMAGLIGGKDPGADPRNPGTSYLGVAPDARIVNVKVGSGSGAVDVSQVIAGIDWVVQHRRDNGLNIRVLNLSIGTNSSQSYQLDPLAFAAEVAWRSGIVVVAAAGNSGATYGHLDDPASDPYVIAVGASGTTGGLLGNLLVAAFSSIGNGDRNPDLIAPGSHAQGLRVPGSYIDQNFHSAAFGDRFFRGSGTSEAAALTSGAVALLLQKRPWLQPGQVKAILTKTAAALPLVPAKAQGSGVLRVAAAVSDGVSVPDGGQGYGQSSGTGSLEGARGDKHVQVNGVPLTGEEDIFGHDFNSSDHAAHEASGQGWSSEGGWNGTTWSGTTWSGTTWSGTTWSGTTWSGTTWSGTTWSGTTWSGTTWSGTTWSGTTWSGTTWSGTTWSGEIWSSYSWS